MKKILLNSKIFFVTLACLLTVSVHGQPNGLYELTDIKSHIVKSDYSKKDYCLKVLLPANYSMDDTTKYPVLFVLDGRYSTALFYSIIENFALGKELMDFIVVTIDGHNQSQSQWLTSRYHDYTPSFNPQTDTAIAGYFKLPVTNSGGAPAFLATMEKEIIPLIEHNYKTSSDRAIYGHSLGGLFAGYCLVTRPVLFQKYSMNSPSFWWNNGEMTNKIDSLAGINPEISADIYVSAGVLEGEFMISPVTKCLESLNHKFPKVKVTSKIFDDETHLSMVSVACNRTLRIFYGQNKK